MIELPYNDKIALVGEVNNLIDQCRVSQGMRASYYRLMNAIAETGRYDGTKALINLLYSHLTRTADHLFSPVELKFSIDFERPKPKTMYERGQITGKTLTRTWERNNTDMTFGRGVFEALKYGAAFLKQWPQMEGPEGDEDVVYYDKLVMPWQFGVYREDETRLDRQEALCETSSLTMPEVWRRIWHLPNARKLMERIQANSSTGQAGQEPNSYFHQVLSANQIQTGLQSATQPIPGGIVQLNNDPNYSIMGPTIGAATVSMHELWVKDEDDYVTIQMIEPDILIAPIFKKANLLGVKKAQPYRIIQPNEVTNWIWGRSELVDLIEPQGLLAQWCDDARRMMGLQIDKIMGFTGETNITDELYAQFRQSGYINLGAGADIKDVTTKFPPELLPMIKWCIETINTLGGFPDIMQGKGESGVRAGVHADTLLKTASPTLRDRSLLVERQCAVAADLTLQIMEAKDEEYYFVKADTPEEAEATKFLLSELPDDWRVTVDSHSSSPIFSDENTQLIFAARKLGIVTDEYVIDNMPFPNREMAKVQKREQEAAKAKQMQELLKANPEAAEKVLGKQLGGKKG